VALQLALAIVLLTGAGLMLKSFWRMNAKPPGFAPESILVMRVSLSAPQYRSWPPQEAYLHELLQRVNTAPGVLAVGIDCGTLNTAVRVEGAQQNSTKEPPLAAVRFVSPGYLHAIGVPLVKGRWPTEGESLDVVLVNQSFTRKIVTGDPVGRPISGSFLSGTTVGVVADFKYWQLDAEPRPEVYVAYEWSPVVRSVRVVVRISGDARLAASSIRRLISDIDQAQPVYELQTLEQALSDSIAPRRFNMFLLGTFAATALLLGLIGIYGGIAYSVAQRTNEIGIRRTLGAQRGDIVRMVVWQGMQMAVAGIGVGLAAALGLTHLMASLLYDVKANDPLTFVAVALTLAATALLACWIPALKAALVDPTVALRCE
jgi:putative ABC transport system permease protein